MLRDRIGRPELGGGTHEMGGTLGPGVAVEGLADRFEKSDPDASEIQRADEAEGDGGESHAAAAGSKEERVRVLFVHWKMGLLDKTGGLTGDDEFLVGGYHERAQTRVRSGDTALAGAAVIEIEHRIKHGPEDREVIQGFLPNK